MEVFSHSSLILLLGGMAMFMFGMTLASDYLQKLAANNVRVLLAKLSESRVLAVLTGVGLTILLQSSGAVTSMLVGLGTAKVISLQQVMGVIVGTAIGSTLTVQLISFHLQDYGLGAFFFAFMIYFLTSKRVLKNVAGVGMGFGLMFFGLELMGYGTQIFKSSPMLIEIITDLSKNPLILVAVTALFTGFIHSSAAVIGLAMSLAQADLISLNDSMYWVYGANIGTTSTALMAAVGSNYIGRQVAWAHFFYKIGSVVAFYFFTDFFVALIDGFGGTMARDVANAHTIFNMVSALLFFPFINIGADKIQQLIKRQASEEDFTTKYLKTETYNTPGLGLAHAQREILRMGDIVLSMIRDSLELFKGENPELQESIRERDNQVDLLNREIKLYLVNFQNTSGGLGKNILRLIELCTDLEAAADVIDGGVLELARKKQALKLEFSPQGWQELCDFHSTVIEIVTMSLSAAHLQDPELATRAISKKRELRKKERELRESHLTRLNQGLRESINTSSIHLDLLSDYRQIVSQVVNHAYSVAGFVGSSQPEQLKK